MSGLIRCNERVHVQAMKLVSCVRPIVTGVGDVGLSQSEPILRQHISGGVGCAEDKLERPSE